MIPDRWGDYPTWLAAIGTVGAVIVALFLAGADARRRAREQHARQAELVTAWLGPVPQATEDDLTPLRAVTLLNGSQQLAYRVIASMVPVRGAVRPDFRTNAGDFRAFVGELPPGRTDLTIPHPGSGMHIRWAVELAFMDAAGHSWVRGPDGRLKKVRKEPAKYYGLNEPIPW